MAEFHKHRELFSQAKSAQRVAEEELFAAKQKLAAIERETERLARFGGAGNSENALRIKALTALKEENMSRAQAAEAQRASAVLRADKALDALRPFLIDPQAGVQNLPDDTPILMLPLRLETRFKKVVGPSGAPHDELWVRVYPDDGAIENFEPVLSESEFRSAEIFWTEMWKASGQEARERAAWRGLVAAHGSGRAAWIFGYAPFQPDARYPKKVSTLPGHLALVARIALKQGQAELFSEREKNEAARYWESIWRADGAAAAERAAWQAFSAAVGAGKAPEVVEYYKPGNLADLPPPTFDRETTSITFSLLALPPLDGLDVRLQSWSRAPKVRTMPEKLLLIGDGKVLATGATIPAALAVGPDPSATKDQPDLRQDNEDLILGESIRWLTDFEEALRVGMAFRVRLDEREASKGFRRLMVLGVRLGADAAEGKEMLAQLIQNHRYSANGFGLLPQGVPTNNTESADAGYLRSDDPDLSFDLLFGENKPSRPAPNDELARWDGDWLAHWLGLSPDSFGQVPYAAHTDQSEARAMNTALWPATMGYMMDSMMQEVFSDKTEQDTRAFFTRYVSGRGPVPAIRIGRQPYGILPTARFSALRWMRAKKIVEEKDLGAANWPNNDTSTRFTEQLYDLLLKLTPLWDGMKERGDWVGKKSADPHQTLLNVLGLHATSVEYYQRFTPGKTFYWNFLRLANVGWLANFFPWARRNDLPETPDFATGLDDDGLALLRSMGYTGEDTPEILDKIYQSNAQLLQGPVVDDRPLSEKDGIRAYTEDNRNYVKWLLDAANTPETLRKEEGFLNGVRPSALLYLTLHKALLEGFFDAGLLLYAENKVAETTLLRKAKIDAPFIHIKPNVGKESKFEWLYVREPRIGERLVVDEVAARLHLPNAATRRLSEQLRALEKLENVPTARLERLFAEHMDCCSYRLDAWKQGILHQELDLMRQRKPSTGNSPGGGVYLGAYGWLENVRPENKKLETVAPLSSELADAFQRNGDPVLTHDPANAGHILAPSLNHAVTAAVLRNGYISNASAANPDTLAVNLSSERVRQAMAIVEGIRNGQSLGALLGYRLERGLHDRYDGANNIFLDEIIFELRRAFPLYGNLLNEAEAEQQNEAVEARNVVNGLDLLNHIKKTDNARYPFGLATLPVATLSAAERAAIDAEVDRLLDVHDAVADMALAEAVHQTVLGNYERAGSTLDAYGKGEFPPIPEVVQTPRTGVGLTHRVGLHLDPGAVAPVDATPRARAEPVLNAWLGARLPALDKIGAVVHVVDGALPIFVSAKKIGLQPIDLLFLVDAEKDAAMGELDDRIEHTVRTDPGLSVPGDQNIRIAYTEQHEEGFTFFEVAPLLKSLRVLLLQSRPLRPSDLAVQDEATKGLDSSGAFPVGRRAALESFLQNDWNGAVNGLKKRFQDEVGVLAPRYEALQTLRAQIDNPAPGADLQALEVQLEIEKTGILPLIDGCLDRMAGLLLEAGAYGIPETGTGILYEERRRILVIFSEKIKAYSERWEKKSAEYVAAIAAFEVLRADAASSAAEQIALLRQAEALISTTIVSGETAAALEGPIKAKKPVFDTKKAALQMLAAARFATLQAARQAAYDFLDAPLIASEIDLLSLDLREGEGQMLVLGQDLLKRAAKLAFELGETSTDPQKPSLGQKIAAKLALHDAAADGEPKMKHLVEAAQLMFGEDFRLIPVFDTGLRQAAEWTRALADTELLAFQENVLGNDFPVDDWMHGVARVREKIGHWENLAVLSDSFALSEPELRPLQFPYKTNDRWLALQYRLPTEGEADFARPDADRLLYTAHYAQTPDPARVCGLLLDEWTEVLPSETETVGAVFHYDRPNTEPPQAWLLVLPTDFRGAWQWEDIVGALDETLDEAKCRLVEPSFVDDTALARFLPATMSSVTHAPISIALNYARNNFIPPTA